MQGRGIGEVTFLAKHSNYTVEAAQRYRISSHLHSCNAEFSPGISFVVLASRFQHSVDMTIGTWLNMQCLVWVSAIV